jgi:hypothetical protein
MAREIILYNLKEGVSVEDYQKWCQEYKGPLLLGLGSVERFTLINMLGGITGDGQKGLPPQETKPPYQFIGVMELSGLEEWKKDTDSKAFKEEFFPQWFSNWVADFYVLAGMEIFDKSNA